MAFALTPTHIHLLLNHFPTIGFMIGLGLFVISLIAKSEHLKLGSLVVLVGVSIITIPTYITGNAAGEVLLDREQIIRADSSHEKFAKLEPLFAKLNTAWSEKLGTPIEALHHAGMGPGMVDGAALALIAGERIAAAKG